MELDADPRFHQHTERSALEILSRWFPGQDTFRDLDQWQAEGCSGHRVTSQPAEPARHPGGCGPHRTHSAFKLLVEGVGPTSLTDRWWKAVAGDLAEVLLVTLNGLFDA